MDEPDISDPTYWKWSIFYYNPKDNNVLVPRPNGLGLTFNYAHKTPYFIIGCILVITLTLVLYNLDILKF